jgi:hypothetical protein
MPKLGEIERDRQKERVGEMIVMGCKERLIVER